MGNTCKKTKDVARAALSEAICHFVGKGKAYSRKAACAAIGCSDTTLENLINAQTACDHAQLMRMAQLFGPTFLNIYLAAFGLTGVRRREKAPHCERMVNTKMARANAVMAEALADGHVDHRERAQMMPLLQDMALTVDGYIATHIIRIKGERLHG